VIFSFPIHRELSLDNANAADEASADLQKRNERCTVVSDRLGVPPNAHSTSSANQRNRIQLVIIGRLDLRFSRGCRASIVEPGLRGRHQWIN